jgi:hypothetical protein
VYEPLGDAVEEFCDRWQLGLDNLTKDAAQYVYRLALERARVPAHRGHRPTSRSTASCAQLARPRIRGRSSEWTELGERPTTRRSSSPRRPWPGIRYSTMWAMRG